jgi:hypothetical protein
LRTLKVIRDEPGQALVLQGESLRLPLAAVGCAALVLIPFLAPALWQLGSGLWNLGRDTEFGVVVTIVSSVIWLAIIGLVARTVHRRIWMPLQLRVDRDAGVLELVERNVLTGRERLFSVSHLHVAGLSVETISGRGPRSAPRTSMLDTFTPNVRITVRIDDASRKARARAINLHVEGVDRREEVADLAYRLGAACGLPYQRVVRSDPRDIELEISPSMGPGQERLPALEGPANYAKNVFSPAAGKAAAEERVPPFDPADFPSDHKVAKWLPGREVSFHRPFGTIAIGCLPFAIAGFLIGPGLFILSTSRRPDAALADRLIPSAVIGLIGLVIGAAAVGTIVMALPRRVTLDWNARTITVGGLFRRTEIPMDDVVAVECRCVHTQHRGGKNSSTYHSYRCEVQLHTRHPAPDGKPLQLLTTMDFREDPDQPYRRTLPLVTELAEALGVERKVTDYS